MFTINNTAYINDKFNEENTSYKLNVYKKGNRGQFIYALSAFGIAAIKAGHAAIHLDYCFGAAFQA